MSFWSAEKPKRSKTCMAVKNKVEKKFWFSFKDTAFTVVKKDAKF